MQANNQKLLVIVPCGKSKIWDRHPRQGPTPARDVYTGSLFKANRAFGEQYGDHWVILSAKYGFIPPWYVISEPYEMTFNGAKTNPVSTSILKQQAEAQHLYCFERIIGLGGAMYRRVTEAAFAGYEIRLEFPTAGLPLGRSIQFIKNYDPFVRG